jgi:hypothetical protein
MDMVVALTRSVTAATEWYSANSFTDSQKEAEELAVLSTAQLNLSNTTQMMIPYMTHTNSSDSWQLQILP